MLQVILLFPQTNVVQRNSSSSGKNQKTFSPHSGQSSSRGRGRGMVVVSISSLNNLLPKIVLFAKYATGLVILPLSVTIDSIIRTTVNLQIRLLISSLKIMYLISIGIMIPLQQII